MIRHRLLAVVGVVAALVTTGCSGIPSNSPPQVVRTLPATEAQAGPELKPPTPGENPRDIINGFLQANLATDAEYTVAKQYLTPEARGQWSTTTATIVSDNLRTGTGTQSGGTTTIKVDAPGRLGTLNSDGEYLPDPTSPAPQESFEFGLRPVNGEWRISSLPPGLIIEEGDFIDNYRLVRALYFFDPTFSYLIPDVRYTAVAGQSLAAYLLDKLLGGPRAGLVGVAQSALPPADTRDARATLNADGQLSIDIPGVSKVEPQVLTRIGAQLAYTYDSANLATDIRLFDGTTPVTLPGGIQSFTPANFPAFDTSPAGRPTAYFLRSGRIYRASDTANPISGSFGRYPLASVAVRGTGDNLTIAGVRTDNGRLLVGTQRGQVRGITLPEGPISRPDWNRHTGQLWVAVDSQVYVVNGTAAKRVAIADESRLPSDFTITAIRVSPEGGRVALVLRTPAGNSSVWVAAIDDAGPIGLAGLTKITPTEYDVADVGWSFTTTLTFLGTLSGVVAVGNVQVDGAALQLQPTVQLPTGEPTAIAASPQALPIVATGNSTNSTLWQQTGDNGWAALDGKVGQVPGLAPVFGD